jgi:hypothetical protein
VEDIDFWSGFFVARNSKQIAKKIGGLDKKNQLSA